MDRNPAVVGSLITLGGSLSARRAWIEILLVYLALIRYLVALRKESVDRNTIVLVVLLMYNLSLSARRAWIEIQ